MKKILSGITVFFIVLLIHSCKKSSDAAAPPPTKGTLSGTVSSSNSQPINGAQIIIFSANTNAPIATITTSANGSYTAQLDSGSYYMKIYAQGYESIPLPGQVALPVSVIVNNTTTTNYQMNTLLLTNIGLISGKVVSSTGTALPGVLIVAHSGSTGYSSVSDNNGNYTIYNMPVNNYSVQGFMAKYNSDSIAVNVINNANTTGSNLTLAAGASGSVTGMITFLSTANKDVDVSIVNPYTKETIPGLTTMTTGGSYTISNVPNGYYLARASYRNDTIVMDPDWILKNGQPYLTVSNTAATRNFSVTNSVNLSSPTNVPSTTFPMKISTTTPTLSWSAYPSTNDYAVEVDDENGNVIWGGFSGSGATVSRNVTVPSSQTSIIFNSDNKATQSLQPGHYYRWRVYACKNVTGVPSWKLISVSEDQMGLITP
jgi:hypothetical protein